MGGKLGRRRERKQLKIKALRSEKCYLLLTTLFFLVLSGLFSHAIVKISVNQIIQLHQFSTAYQAKGALNMGEEILQSEIEKNNRIPTNGSISTSLGEIKMMRISEDTFQLTLTIENGKKFSKNHEINFSREEATEQPENAEEGKIVEVEAEITE